MLIDKKTLNNMLQTNIKSARAKRNLTQDELAEAVELSLTFIKDVEGARSSVSLINFVNLCIALDVTPNDLLRDCFSEVQSQEANSKDLLTQINLLEHYEKNAVETLIQYFNTHRIDK